jgi:hypothetical protein
VELSTIFRYSAPLSGSRVTSASKATNRPIVLQTRPYNPAQWSSISVSRIRTSSRSRPIRSPQVAGRVHGKTTDGSLLSHAIEPVVGRRESFRFGSRTAETTAHRSLEIREMRSQRISPSRHAQERHWAVRPLRGTGDGPAFFAGMLERSGGRRETAVRHLEAAARALEAVLADGTIHLQNGRSSSVTLDMTANVVRRRDSAVVVMADLTCTGPAFRDGHVR